MASKNIYVYADWPELNGPSFIGTLRAESIRGNEIFSFEYNNSWLNSDQLFVLDPDMNYYSGPQYLPDDKPNFGVFLDSSPDRWGRVLMRRREALMARMENRPQKNLTLQSPLMAHMYTSNYGRPMHRQRGQRVARTCCHEPRQAEMQLFHARKAVPTHRLLRRNRDVAHF